MRRGELTHGGVLLSAELRVCSNFWERARGLLWRAPLDALRAEALLIPSCDAIHMVGMRYPIAVIFMDAQGVILRQVPRVRPFCMARCGGAAAALECAVDTPFFNQLSVGDRLEWTLSRG